jgi:hypothetical protein
MTVGKAFDILYDCSGLPRRFSGADSVQERAAARGVPWSTGGGSEECGGCGVSRRPRAHRHMHCWLRTWPRYRERNGNPSLWWCSQRVGVCAGVWAGRALFDDGVCDVPHCRLRGSHCGRAGGPLDDDLVWRGHGCDGGLGVVAGGAAVWAIGGRVFGHLPPAGRVLPPANSAGGGRGRAWRAGVLQHPRGCPVLCLRERGGDGGGDG